MNKKILLMKKMDSLDIENIKYQRKEFKKNELFSTIVINQKNNFKLYNHYSIWINNFFYLNFDTKLSFKNKYNQFLSPYISYYNEKLETDFKLGLNFYKKKQIFFILERENDKNEFFLDLKYFNKKIFYKTYFLNKKFGGFFLNKKKDVKYGYLIRKELNHNFFYGIKLSFKNEDKSNLKLFINSKYLSQKSTFFFKISPNPYFGITTFTEFNDNFGIGLEIITDFESTRDYFIIKIKNYTVKFPFLIKIHQNIIEKIFYSLGAYFFQYISSYVLEYLNVYLKANKMKKMELDYKKKKINNNLVNCLYRNSKFNKLDLDFKIIYGCTIYLSQAKKLTSFFYKLKDTDNFLKIFKKNDIEQIDITSILNLYIDEKGLDFPQKKNEIAGYAEPKDMFFGRSLYNIYEGSVVILIIWRDCKNKKKIKYFSSLNRIKISSNKTLIK